MQLKGISIDQQIRVLYDLNDKYHDMAEIIMNDPSIAKMTSRELAFSSYVMWECSHAFAMRERSS